MQNRVKYADGKAFHCSQPTIYCPECSRSVCDSACFGTKPHAMFGCAHPKTRWVFWWHNSTRTHASSQLHSTTTTKIGFTRSASYTIIHTHTHARTQRAHQRHGRSGVDAGLVSAVHGMRQLDGERSRNKIEPRAFVPLCWWQRQIDGPFQWSGTLNDGGSLIKVEIWHANPCYAAASAWGPRDPETRITRMDNEIGTGLNFFWAMFQYWFVSMSDVILKI